MTFETSPIYDEVFKILHSHSSGVSSIQYTFELYIGTDRIEASRVIDIIIDRDYIGAYCPVTILSVTFPLGVYEKYIVPRRADLRGRLIMNPVKTSSTTPDSTRQINHIEGRAILLDTSSITDNIQISNFSPEMADLSGFKEVRIQLLNPLIERMMVTNAGGTFRVMTSPDFVKGFLLQFSRLIDNEVSYTVDGINVVSEGKNEEIIPNFLIPANIKVIDVPGYVNARISALYPTGLGYFLENKKWFVYPTFNTRLAEKTNDGFLTIIKVPKATVPEIKNSFRVQGKNLFILANEDFNVEEVAEKNFLNEGNGGRWVDSKNMTESFVEKTEDKRMVVDASKNVSEILINESPHGLNHVTGSGKITSNSYKELSELAARNGSVASLTWTESYADYLYPGMPVKVIVWNNGTIKELYGSLLGSYETISSITSGTINSPMYSRSAALTLFLEKDVAGFKNVK